jgi:hypothetical protein
LSRSKAIGFIKAREEVQNTTLKPIPSKGALLSLDRLYMKIGALGELPDDSRMKAGYLGDFWRDLYFYNNLCPADIPFPIILEEFTRGLTQGTIDRKGNNQAAIIKAFNEWVNNPYVRNSLISKEDSMYPNKKPLQLAEKSKPKELHEFTIEELESRLEKLKPIALMSAFAKEIEASYKEELKKRKSKIIGD